MPLNCLERCCFIEAGHVSSSSNQRFAELPVWDVECQDRYCPDVLCFLACCVTLPPCCMVTCCSNLIQQCGSKSDVHFETLQHVTQNLNYSRIRQGVSVGCCARTEACIAPVAYDGCRLFTGCNKPVFTCCAYPEVGLAQQAL